ncbi:MAG: hypothetical protein H7246_22580 [Phycisphaerae bacterium]|nr:hypothetical protein [Saprospiraceae bacterium]
MRSTTFFTAFSALLFLVSCKDKNKTVYEGCCGEDPITDSFFITTKLYDAHGNLVDSTIKANVYIPNIITNDSDGINDIFLVFGGANAISRVISMNCSSENGAPLFHSENFQPNDPGHSWNGLNTDGTIYQGRFNYEVKIEFVDGQVKTYTGEACAYRCNEEGFPTDHLPNCFFPYQHDGNGGLDLSLPAQTDCF